MTRTTTLTITTHELPQGIDAFTLYKDEQYAIYVNDTLPATEQAAAFLHECLHLWHDDTSADLPADVLENVRHRELLEVANIFQQKE